MKKIHYDSLTRNEKNEILDDCTLQTNYDYCDDEIKQYYYIYRTADNRIRAVQKSSKFVVSVHIGDEATPTIFTEDVESITTEKDLIKYFKGQYENTCDVRVTAHTTLNGIVFDVTIPKTKNPKFETNRTVITGTTVLI